MLAEGQVCVLPAVVVDPKFGVAGLDGDVRVSAEFEAISSGQELMENIPDAFSSSQ